MPFRSCLVDFAASVQFRWLQQQATAGFKDGKFCKRFRSSSYLVTEIVLQRRTCSTIPTSGEKTSDVGNLQGEISCAILTLIGAHRAIEDSNLDFQSASTNDDVCCYSLTRTRTIGFFCCILEISDVLLRGTGRAQVMNRHSTGRATYV